MCGRFNVSTDPLARLFLLLLGSGFAGVTANNVAPTESAWLIRARRADGAPEAAEMRWSLLPYWSKEVKTRYAMINARAESMAASSAFREPFARRRCVLPVTGFFEWLTEDGRRLPQHVTAAAGAALLLAAIWDRWHGDGRTIDSFAIVTTAVHANLAFLHDRQPAMLRVAEVGLWLDHRQPLADVQQLLAPRLPLDLLVTPVSMVVNNARNKGDDCLHPTGNPRFVAGAT